jgi:predicted nucleotidyltransferase component of viral defense system
VYSLNEIAAKKTVALTDPARNEPRDLYDLWYLTANEELQLDRLRPAICQKLEFRRKPCEDLQAALAGKEARLRVLWNTRLSYQMAALPPFEQVFREMRRTFRQANLP